MTQSRSELASGQIVDSMLELAGCSKRHRILVTGLHSPQLMKGLHRRGYCRVDTTASCGLPHGQYHAGLINWHGHSVKALEATLEWLVHFLAPSAILVVWVDGREAACHRLLQSMLDRFGFQVEVGIRRAEGVGILACRRDRAAAAMAA
jgi:hypothetical protein